MDTDVKEEEKPWVADGTLPLAADGESMQMHLLDAHEEIGYPGTVYLFGKVRRLSDMSPCGGTCKGCVLAVASSGHV